MTPIHLSRDYAAEGYSYADVSRRHRAGELLRVRRGAYVDRTPDRPDRRTGHLLLSEAIARQHGADAVVSHHSAAVLHGLPLWPDQLPQVHLTRDRRGQGKRQNGVWLHGLPLAAEDVTTVAGIQVTSLQRTVLDVLCSMPMTQAVAIGDAALRAGVRPDALLALLDQSPRRHGIGVARRTIPFLDARAETPGESMSRVRFHQWRLPKPELQFEVYDTSGRLAGRTDFGWPELHTLGEFDGKVKYGALLLKPGQTAEDALFEEKQREDLLRDLGNEMARWIWPDLFAGDPLRLRLLRAFERGRRHH